MKTCANCKQTLLNITWKYCDRKECERERRLAGDKKRKRLINR